MLGRPSEYNSKNKRYVSCHEASEGWEEEVSINYLYNECENETLVTSRQVRSGYKENIIEDFA